MREASMTSAPIRVVIAEDHALMREGTRRILEQQPDITIVGEAEDGARAVDIAVRLRPDVALLDIRMPDCNGVEATRQIRQLAPDTAVLILSAYDDDYYVRALFEVGASGYLLKTVRADELVDAVRRVHAGETVLHPAIARKVAQLLARTSASQRDGVHLTVKELDVLRLVCRGLRNKEISRELAMSVRTVEGHLDAIFNRLGVRSRTEAAMHAASQGWFSEDSETP
jgi:NarL family two-component system response regulator LiaR